jgi:hypothetical protein
MSFTGSFLWLYLAFMTNVFVSLAISVGTPVAGKE